jgi:hypothetical protein
LEIEIDKEEYDGDAHEEAVRRLSFSSGGDGLAPEQTQDALISMTTPIPEPASRKPVPAAAPRLGDVSITVEAELTQKRSADSQTHREAGDDAPPRDNEEATIVSAVTRWQPKFKTTEEFVHIELGITLSLAALRLEAAATGAALHAFMLEGSLDNETWTQIRPEAEEDSDIFEGGQAPFAQHHQLSPPAVAQALRLWPVDWDHVPSSAVSALTLRLNLEAIGRPLASTGIEVAVAASSQEAEEMRPETAWLGHRPYRPAQEDMVRESQMAMEGQTADDDWRPASTDAAPWLELRFHQEMRIGAVKLRPGLDEENRVHAIAIHVQPLGEPDFAPLCDEDGSTTLFIAGSDARTTTAFALPEGITGEAVRVVAIDYLGDAVMAVDVLAEPTGRMGPTAAQLAAAREAERARQLAAEEEARQKAAAEAARRREEEEERRLAEERQRLEEERQRLAEEEAARQARAFAEDEARRQAEAAEAASFAEAERQARNEEEAERRRLAAEEEARRRLQEEEDARTRAEAARLRAAREAEATQMANMWPALLAMLELLANEVKTEIIDSEKLKVGLKGCQDMPVNIRKGAMAQLLQDSDELAQGVEADCDELTRQMFEGHS